MESGTVVKWLKAEGEPVAKGEPLYELDTEKVTQEVEAEASGVLLRIAVPAGEVAVGTTVAFIGEPGEEVSAPTPLGDGTAGAEKPAEAPEREPERERGRAAALMRHREVNVQWADDALLRLPSANVGIAVAAPQGLVVPVVHAAERLTLAEIAGARAEVVGRAREGKLRREDLEGGTFTISN